MSVFEKSQVKSENIMIRVTVDQKAAIMDRANSKGMTVSEYLLFLCGKDFVDLNDSYKSTPDD